MAVKILVGDCREILKSLPDESVHCVVTSPPYLGLRDYGAAGQIGLEATPEEFIAEIVLVFREVRRVLRKDGTLWLNLGDSYSASGNGGHQRSRPQGATGQMAARSVSKARDIDRNTSKFHGHRSRDGDQTGVRRVPPTGIKAKDLMGIPWAVAFALRADGWFLRQEIIWAKPNPMPESVYDRCTKSHETIFLLAKSERYFYDAEAIAEPVTISTLDRMSQENLENQAGSDRVPGKTNGPMKAVLKRSGNKERKQRKDFGGNPDHGGNQAHSIPWEGATRNKRSVWTITTQPFKEAHFATFPPALVEPCILAGTSGYGVCPDCGSPWRRVAEKTLVAGPKAVKRILVDERDLAADAEDRGSNWRKAKLRNGSAYSVQTTGWRPLCSCYDARYEAESPRPRSAKKRAQRDAWEGRWKRVRNRPGLTTWPITPATVLDPFGGAGTTGLVADRFRRGAILIELNPKFAAMAERRLTADAPLFAEVAAQ